MNELVSGKWTEEEDRKWCEKCIYKPGEGSYNHWLCDYYSITGKRRGCKPGVGCTRKTTKKRGRRPATAPTNGKS